MKFREKLHHLLIGAAGITNPFHTPEHVRSASELRGAAEEACVRYLDDADALDLMLRVAEEDADLMSALSSTTDNPRHDRNF